MYKTLTIMCCAALLGTACSGRKSGGAKLRTDVDSVAYIIGLNVGENLMKMDSTMNVNAVCEGIRDRFRGKTKMTMAEAKTYFLRYQNYMLPEKALGLEEQYLADLAKKNRNFARTPSGVTYEVTVLGDQTLLPTSDRDSVALRLLIRDTEGQQVYSSYEQKDTLRTKLGLLRPGIKESVKLIGKGGKIDAWIASSQAYGADGDKTLNIRPNATLEFEIELVGLGKQSSRPGENGRIKY